MLRVRLMGRELLLLMMMRRMRWTWSGLILWTILSGRRGSRQLSLHRHCSSFLHTLHTVLHQVNLHAHTIDLVDAIREPLQLTCEHLEISSIVSRGLRDRGTSAHLYAHVVQHGHGIGDLVMQSANDALDFSELSPVGLQHARVVRDLRL